jgi:hypothetical protein
MMRKYLLLLVLVSTTVCSQTRWIPYSSGDTSTGFVDDSSVKKVGNNVRVWVLYELKQPRQNGLFTLKSYIEYLEFDCKDGRVFSHKQVMYSESMGGGSNKDNSFTKEWDFIVPDSFNDILLKEFCIKK